MPLIRGQPAFRSDDRRRSRLGPAPPRGSAGRRGASHSHGAPVRLGPVRLGSVPVLGSRRRPAAIGLRPPGSRTRHRASAYAEAATTAGAAPARVLAAAAASTAGHSRRKDHRHVISLVGLAVDTPHGNRVLRLHGRRRRAGLLARREAHRLLRRQRARHHRRLRPPPRGWRRQGDRVRGGERDEQHDGKSTKPPRRSVDLAISRERIRATCIRPRAGLASGDLCSTWSVDHRSGASARVGTSRYALPRAAHGCRRFGEEVVLQVRAKTPSVGGRSNAARSYADSGRSSQRSKSRAVTTPSGISSSRRRTST